ncbi:MAG TPA: BON domain-containing protein [Capsulimonadaceae bacterium]
MATAEEVNLARDIRRMFAKKPVDSTRLEIQCIRGRVYLSGTINVQRDEVGVNAREEVLAAAELVSRMKGVKQVINELRVVIPEKKKKPEHEASPGGHGGGH